MGYHLCRQVPLILDSLVCPSMNLVSSKLLVVLLAITMAVPSWPGSCCCSRKAASELRPCCRSALVPSVANQVESKRPCCARRGEVRQTSDTQHVKGRPLSSCRCQKHVVAIATSGSIRNNLFKSEIPRASAPAHVTEMSQTGLPSALLSQSAHHRGDSPTAKHRCAELCRWLV